MDCPHCEQPIAATRFAWGPCRPQLFDRQGNALDGLQTLWLSCEHCGEFEIEFDFFRNIKAFHGPFTSDRDCRRVLSHLPVNRGRPLPQHPQSHRRRKSA